MNKNRKGFGQKVQMNSRASDTLEEHLNCINKPLSEASKQQILSYLNLDENNFNPSSSEEQAKNFENIY